MISWRGWGGIVVFVIIFIAGIVSLGLVGASDTEGLRKVGGLVPAMMLAAGMNFGLDRLIDRISNNPYHEFMGIAVENWTLVFLGIGGLAFVTWLIALIGGF
jgi:hypothetical protein